MGYLHRDDVPFELAESLQKELQEKHPGAKVMFAGDHDDLPEEVEVAIKVHEYKMATSLYTGTCLDCWDFMKGYLKAQKDRDLEYMIPDGWGLYRSGSTGEPSHYLCPKCEKKSSGERLHKIIVQKKPDENI